MSGMHDSRLDSDALETWERSMGGERHIAAPQIRPVLQAGSHKYGRLRMQQEGRNRDPDFDALRILAALDLTFQAASVRLAGVDPLELEGLVTQLLVLLSHAHGLEVLQQRLRGIHRHDGPAGAGADNDEWHLQPFLLFPLMCAAGA